MARVLLLHWNRDECIAMAATLAEAGVDVRPVWAAGDVKLADIHFDPPRALVISLRRLPSHGREVADAVCSTEWGRQIPLIFVDGIAQKVEALRARLPSATFVRFDGLADLLRELS